MARHFQGRIDYMSEAQGNVGREYFDRRTGTGKTLQLFTTPGDWLPIKTVVPEHKRWYELAEFREFRKA